MLVITELEPDVIRKQAFRVLSAIAFLTEDASFALQLIRQLQNCPKETWTGKFRNTRYSSAFPNISNIIVLSFVFPYNFMSYLSAKNNKTARKKSLILS